ncbi:hypothetical protein ACTXT7_003961 [Hymenolepis weldensis]
MEHLPENLFRQGSQAFEVVPPRGAQLLVYPSNFSSQRPTKTPQKLVKLSNKFKRLLALASAIEGMQQRESTELDAFAFHTGWI